MLNALALAAASGLSAVQAQPTTDFLVERISTKASFPRGLQLVDGRLHVVCRGRVRDYGGVSAEVDDQAGTLYVIDPEIAEEYAGGEPGPAVRENGVVLAAPTSPPFRLWDRQASPPWKDRETDRPYCGLTWHPTTRSFYICAFSGIDRDENTGKSFSKNLSDAILRYDLRTSKWYEVERHDIDKGGLYPHHDPALQKPPHGWLNGPDNCLAVGSWLYAVSKENSRLVLYDLRALEKDPEAGAPPSEPVFEESVETRNAGRIQMQGHSALAVHDGWLYVGTRTTGHVVRLKLGVDQRPAEPRRVELVARFDAYDPQTKRSANVTDMSFGPEGHLHLISAKPSRCYRFLPDPKRIYDARDGKEPAYIDLAAWTGNPKMKSENLLVDAAGRVYITSGDAYSYHAGSGGVVWRVTPKPKG
ncbi:MAG: hypothetical protein NTY35_15035 [Planctomycetota bacterium]|nr:hypothetical protein [Planctomycetota bacterium]